MQQTETSKKEWEEFREWEKKKHQDFFLPFYQNKGFEIIEDYIDKFYPCDVKLRKNGKIYLVDEKARKGEYRDFLVEILQCLLTGKIGWLYGPKTNYFYASWLKENLEGEPTSAYWINSKKLIDFMVKNFNQLDSKISEKGYGLTFNKVVKWEDLLYLKIAYKII